MTTPTQSPKKVRLVPGPKSFSSWIRSGPGAEVFRCLNAVAVVTPAARPQGCADRAQDVDLA